MTQSPRPGERLLFWRGDTLSVALDATPNADAAFRTNLGGVWRDMPMRQTRPGHYEIDIRLDTVGIFSGKTCLFARGNSEPEWPDGENIHVKVCPARAKSGASIYTVFPRQFGSFREIIRRLPTIMGDMGFSIIQTLPPFPVPVTYAKMGEYGCPFAATDFFSVDPAMAEFDTRATPFDQFRELVDAVHARDGLFFIDLPANHTGWASALQTHHPEWFKRKNGGEFVSPGAWGVTWEDLVELDYSHASLRDYMADVFLFWCRNGIDGFRCDAGYMIPCDAWKYIVGRVRAEYPDTIFMLEGLGGDPRATDKLLCEAGLDWAYSELFQTYDRNALEAYLPQAMARSGDIGTLVHFAETHDNDRLAKSGETYARLRVMLAAFLSAQGAWGIANGVEWFCTEKIDVHGRNSLSWGAERNMVRLIGRLNAILRAHPTFSGACSFEVATRGPGNTLAVVRKSPSGGKVLVLANLDCRAPVRIGWDAAAFSPGKVRDLVTGDETSVESALDLAPGEVKCLERPPVAAGVHRQDTQQTSSCAAFRCFLPDDTNRIVAVPEGETLRVTAKCLFRMDVVDPSTGHTLCALHETTHTQEGLFEASFTVPAYSGDGTCCRALRISGELFADDGTARHLSVSLSIPPPPESAAVALAFDGETVRRDPARRAILSNGAGTASQMRAGWARIESQYDAILSFNPNASCPSDRVNVLARMRCWARWRGYSCELDASCATMFAASPDGKAARWEFNAVFCDAMSASFAIDVSLVHGENAVNLTISRTDASNEPIDIIARPDLEWRSFHDTTKAGAGPEKAFAAACREIPRGFAFSPYGDTFTMSASGKTVFTAGPEWTYCVSHGEEASRGLDPCGDLFSPGWFRSSLGAAGSVSFSAAVALRGSPRLSRGRTKSVSPVLAPQLRLPLPQAIAKALDLFIVRRDKFKTVVAGYPWFLDWGRDTFIFMRGMIAAGRLEDSVAILRAFAAFEDRGTLPNIIYGETAGNRDTSDAPLWFIRCVMEAEAAGANVSALRDTCGNIVDGYLAGTPNGIRVDGDTSLVWSPSHFTWMDTNYPACTPREGYPVEIQALWISALEYTGRDRLASSAKTAFNELFGRESGGLCDCLAAPRGVSAANASKDSSLRPNQLVAASLKISLDQSIPLSAGRLVVPGAIRSLDGTDAAYRGVYAGDENTSRKPAYHNGTAWGWMFPMYAEALAATGAAEPRTALAVLASAVENLNAGGCIGHMSEIVDGDAPHAQKGCAAQAWSVSELLRVWMALSRAG